MSSFFTSRPKAKAATAAVDTAQHQPWTEKYRPKSVDDVAAQDETVRVLKHSIQSANLPHMLFYGPPGSGKTSTILALARELYGHEWMKSRVLELNASDERGINVVRQKVKDFARIQVSQQTPTTADSNGKTYAAPPYKLIILDEADSMTVDAQSALRRTMETYSKVTRFCLICNYVSRIIEPLASRCAKFRFKALSADEALNRVQRIAMQESLQCSTEVLRAVVTVSGGDLRKAITYLQSAVRMGDTQLTVDNIHEIAGVVPSAVIERLVAACKQSGSVPEMVATMRDVILHGYSGTQLLMQLHDALVLDESCTGIQKAKILMQAAQTEKRLHDGGDEELQLLSLCHSIHAVTAQA